MKILIDLTSLADNFSGIERYAACLTKEMIKHKEHNFILVFKESIHTFFLNNAGNENVDIIILKRCNKLFFNQIRLPWAIRKYKVDYYLFLAFPVPILLFKKNMISTIHDICCWDCPETMNGLSKWYFRISHIVAMLKCKSIITISKFSENRIVEKLKYNKNKIWLIYCGIDEIFLNYKHDNEKKELVKEKYNLPEQYILSLSTLEPRKNLQLLVKAYRRLVLENSITIPLVLAGRKGWKIDELLSGIENEVKDKICFTGFIDEQDLADVYGNAKLFVFPSKYEGFGIPPLEAMACETMVISSDSTALPEVLGDAAIYFKNEVEISLVDKLREVIFMPENEEQDIVQKGVIRTNKFNWKYEAEKLLNKMVIKEK